VSEYKLHYYGGNQTRAQDSPDLNQGKIERNAHHRQSTQEDG
jgi:hypothetical protein